MSGPGMNLTPQDLQVVRGLWDGLSPKEVAGGLGCSHQAIKDHMRRIRNKNGARSTIALLRRAVREGVLTP